MEGRSQSSVYLRKCSVVVLTDGLMHVSFSELHFLRTDVFTDLPFVRSFDAVVCSSGAKHVPSFPLNHEIRETAFHFTSGQNCYRG